MTKSTWVWHVDKDIQKCKFFCNLAHELSTHGLESPYKGASLITVLSDQVLGTEVKPDGEIQRILVVDGRARGRNGMAIANYLR